MSNTNRASATEDIIIRPANELFSTGCGYPFTVSHEGDDFANFLEGFQTKEAAVEASAKHAIEYGCTVLDMTATPWERLKRI